jgi:hypothetical protein
MLFAQSMKKDMWVASVDLSLKPRQYSQPKLYQVNVLPTSDGSDVVAYGSRLSEIERARMSRSYGADIKRFDRVWILEKGATPPPANDVLASTAPYVVRAIKDTPLIRTVEVLRLQPYDNELK